MLRKITRRSSFFSKIKDEQSAAHPQTIAARRRANLIYDKLGIDWKAAFPTLKTFINP
ncbi:MAG: hypothetical protein ACK5LK_01720 [Chthoniobacterales bacterium]